MKKSLLSFLILILCISLSPTKIFAQEVCGGSSSGYVDPVDGGINTPVFTAPPCYVKSVKRNNGNATSIGGTAEARLQISKSYTGGDITLINVAYLDKPTVSLNAVITGLGILESGYFSYALSKNINPAKKLLFYFTCTGGTTFCLPETD